MPRRPAALRAAQVTRLPHWPVALALPTVLALLLVATAGRFGAVGQDVPAATPFPFPGAVPLATPEVPLPEECQVAPRTLVDLVNLPATPSAFAGLAPPAPPADLREATPAGEETAQMVLAVIRESIACSNAGQLLRNFALFTDDYVRRTIAVSAPFDQETYDDVATPRPVAPERYIRLVGIGQVLLLPGGRAAVEIVASEVRPRRSLVLLLLTPAGWRIDGLIPLDDAPPPATPPATPAARSPS